MKRPTRNQFTAFRQQVLNNGRRLLAGELNRDKKYEAFRKQVADNYRQFAKTN